MFDFLNKLVPGPSVGLGVGFEDVKHAIRAGPTKFILINTFEQDSMIQGTVSSDKEETVINAQLTERIIPEDAGLCFGRL